MSSGKFFDSFKRSNLKFSEYEVEEDLIPVTLPVVNKRKSNGNYNYENKMNKSEMF